MIKEKRSGCRTGPFALKTYKAQICRRYLNTAAVVVNRGYDQC